MFSMPCSARFVTAEARLVTAARLVKEMARLVTAMTRLVTAALNGSDLQQVLCFPCGAVPDCEQLWRQRNDRWPPLAAAQVDTMALEGDLGNVIQSLLRSALRSFARLPFHV